MKVVADENIPYVREAFATLGDVSTRPGREISAADVAAARILLVRSVTQVDESLLAHSKLRFVASATIGTDHIDLDYLRARAIGFANAPGCNATSAAEYVISALHVLAARHDLRLHGKTAGIVGCGNVGSRVQARLEALGMQCLINDPPRAATEGNAGFASLDDIAGCDIVTVHVPLTRGGDHPTWHLLSDAFLSQLKPGAILINAARGPAVDNTALSRLLDARPDLHVVLDVWEGEPAIDTGLLHKVELATPHIAGYSIDGKLRGTEMILQAACRYFGVSSTWTAEPCLPAPAHGPVHAGDNPQPEVIVRRAVLTAYDVRDDDADLRATAALTPMERASAFDNLRKNYPVRREFNATTVMLQGTSGPLAATLAGLGFRVEVMAASKSGGALADAESTPA